MFPQFHKNIWATLDYVRQNPARHFNETEKMQFDQYYNLLESKVEQANDPCKKTILLYIASAMFYEMISQNTADRTVIPLTPGEQTKQTDVIFKRFMDAVTADSGRHRTVEYYARQLCYTPKYLSQVVKQVSGKNAFALINENAVEHIISELKFTNKDIKQIAFDFEFSNNSFFTRFFRKHTGMTPTEYRNRPE